jgi:hypothetical protein
MNLQYPLELKQKWKKPREKTKEYRKKRKDRDKNI